MVEPKLIVCEVDVDRSRTAFGMLKATGCKLYVRRKNIMDMPRGRGSRVEVTFFWLGYIIREEDLQAQYDLRNLVPADPYSQAAVNEQDFSFLNDHPNVTRWTGTDCSLKICFFGRNPGGRKLRFVKVCRSQIAYEASWWFAGLPK